MPPTRKRIRSLRGRTIGDVVQLPSGLWAIKAIGRAREPILLIVTPSTTFDSNGHLFAEAIDEAPMKTESSR